MSCHRDPRAARGRFEEQLRCLLQARAAAIREDPAPPLPPPRMCSGWRCRWALPDGRARVELVFDVPRAPDDHMCTILAAAAHVAAMLLEVERAGGRLAAAQARRQDDGAAPLIGSSEAMRRLRDRIEKIAVTDFAILIEGAIGPEPHPNSIEVFLEAGVG